MNILHVFGNGFDMNLDIPTSYLDFYKYYQEVADSSDLVQKLKSEISKDIETWADLEFSFGNYTSKLRGIEELDEVYDNLQEHLIEYLNLQESYAETKIKEVSKQDFYEDLAHPENHLGLQKKLVKEFKSNWSESDWNVNIVSLNYTKTVEKIIDFQGEKIEIGSHGNNSIFLENIFHVHGTIDNQMILGVNDISQIANPALLKDSDVLDTLIKTRRNQAYLNENNLIFDTYIKKADLICIFGCSIGWTDRIWWQKIGSKLRGECRLIIFGRGPKYNTQMAYKYMRTANGLKDHFLEMLTADASYKTQARDKIITAIRTDIFNHHRK